MGKVTNAILEKFKEKFNVDEVDKEKALKDYGLDSLDMVELILDLEEEHNIKFSDEEMTGLQTIGDLLNSISSKIDDK
ncbi:MAG: phosphopantetheine-binding protein [Bacilli bacterium]|jgi:acyl carrier protein|nr:acyl carrier protein [Erysipelotrichia bacterium]